MADLKYDTITMRKTASFYKDIAWRMRNLSSTLKKQITMLKDECWKSDAGTAFLKMYEDGWADNVEKYVLILEEMAVQLNQAAQEYDTVTAKLREIEGIS